ncbi:hypothetical protein ACH5RR_018549 [Cinchona calisaya]|uniref:Integrase catalytic domain-containing protein n=1 Tax=Cinchona calisaya TaxID=153742 RepID=A0ABD2ZLT0_9GENT
MFGDHLRYQLCLEKKWFVSFIDDHTRLSWVYLLRDKFEVKDIFRSFYTMVEIQFQEKIRIFRSDNGREYFNEILGDFFLEKGIVHQRSCLDSPQQNGIAERKNRHLLEVTRALLFTNNVPKYLWGEALLTTIYLINRMPSKVLNFQSLPSVFDATFPTSRLTNNLPLRVFGCGAFIHLPDQTRGKLDPRARKCVFVGYAPNQKGYKCYDPSTKKMFVTMDVTFFESQFFFHSHIQGGEVK